ncbi:MAG: hypothetical protein RML12_01895 [Xanthomonadales bacterium]|nr:hypothetical protein [Xanthomonadales bacterium]
MTSTSGRWPATGGCSRRTWRSPRSRGGRRCSPLLQRRLAERFGIRHATLQAEPPAYREAARTACAGCPLDDHAH